MKINFIRYILLLLVILVVMFFSLKTYSFMGAMVLTFIIALLALIVIFFIIKRDSWKELKNTLKKPKKLIPIFIESMLFSLVVGVLLTYVFPLIFLYQTDIKVSCKNEFPMVKFEFDNRAPVPGEDFHLEIYSKNVGNLVSLKPWVMKQCEGNPLKNNVNDTKLSGFRVECSYIPPKTVTPFSFEVQKPAEYYHIGYWSKTTPYALIEKLKCD